MRLLLGLAALFLSLPLAAQPDPLPPAFDSLGAEIRAAPLPGEVYLPQLAEAWDRALAARRFGRADSVAVLAEVFLAETTGLPLRDVVWPSFGDRLALTVLLGDPGPFEWLEEGGRWRGALYSGPSPGMLFGPGLIYTEHLDRRPMLALAADLRFSTRTVLAAEAQDAAQRFGRPEEAALAGLLADALTRPVQFAWASRVRTPEQDALNERADVFLAAFPQSPYAAFVRARILQRYRLRGSASLYLGFGAGAGGEGLGEASDYSVAGDLGVGVRYDWGHVGLGLHGADLRVVETRTADDGRTLEQGDRLTVALVALSGGPRLALGDLDVLPYVGGGLLLQNVSGSEPSVPRFSSYTPPTTLGWAYGLAMEYVPRRRSVYGGFGVRLRADRTHPRLPGFGGAVDGPLTSVTLGFTMTGLFHERVE